MTTRRRRWVLTLLAAVALLAGACGGSDDGPSEAEPPADASGDEASGNGETPDSSGETLALGESAEYEYQFADSPRTVTVYAYEEGLDSEQPLEEGEQLVAVEFEVCLGEDGQQLAEFAGDRTLTLDDGSTSEPTPVIDEALLAEMPEWDLAPLDDVAGGECQRAWSYYEIPADRTGVTVTWEYAEGVTWELA